MKVVQLNPSVILHGSLIEPGKFKGLLGAGWAQIFNVGTQQHNHIYRVEFIEDTRYPAAEIEWPWVLVQLAMVDVDILAGDIFEDVVDFAGHAIFTHREALEAKKKKDEKEAKKAKKV